MQDLPATLAELQVEGQDTKLYQTVTALLEFVDGLRRAGICVLACAMGTIQSAATQAPPSPPSSLYTLVYPSPFCLECAAALLPIGKCSDEIVRRMPFMSSSLLGPYFFSVSP